LGGTGGGTEDLFFSLRFLRQRKKKKRPIAPAIRRAATAEPTPMPIAAGVLTPPEEEEGCWVGTRTWVAMVPVPRGDVVRLLTENPV
jgi:hypothetical protein